MLTATLLSAYNTQICHEFHNKLTYTAMKAYFVSESLEGFASFMDKQAKGEEEHAQKFISYVQDHHDLVEIGTIEKPKANFKNALDIFKAALELEKGTTAKIKALYQLAIKENDFASQAMLDWFVTEQVEEETTIQKVIDKLEGIGSAYVGLLILDEQLAG